jgi:hypothetical protein
VVRRERETEAPGSPDGSCPVSGSRPKLLDLFSGAGGCARGYQLAGFHVTGVDNRPQPRYAGDAFILGDALAYCAEHGDEYDAIHASPPCQGYSVMRHLPWLRDREYPLLIDPVRTLLRASEKPWVIENVMGAKLDAFYLCGLMFDLPFYRHRLFETSFFWFRPRHPRHRTVVQPGGRIGDRAHQIVFTTPHRGGRASRTEARRATPNRRRAWADELAGTH